MAYEKNTWYTGDVITAEKLNNMENGIEAASRGGGGGSDLPEFSYSDVGKMLAVSCTSGGQILKWQIGVPACESWHEGKALVVAYTYNDASGESEYMPVWGSVGGGSNQWENYEIPTYSYRDYNTGDVLAIGSGMSTSCPLEWKRIIGVPDYSNGNDGDVLVVAICNSERTLEWQTRGSLPDPSDLSPGDTLQVTDSSWGKGWNIPVSGCVEDGAVLVIEDTSSLSCKWAAVGLPDYSSSSASEGDILAIVDGRPTWVTPDVPVFSAV